MSEIKILGIPGSIRKESYNKMLLRYISKILPLNTKMKIFDGLHLIPIFNQDEETNPPAIVREFKNKISEADALIFATPEYNRSIPGVLKNAIDWASRPYYDNSFKGKIAAIVSASIGMLGGSLAHYHLVQILTYLDVHVINQPEVFISFAKQKFDGQGNLIDETANNLISQLLSKVVEQANILKLRQKAIMKT